MSREATKRFLAGKVFAVVGASADRSKFGNKVLRCYLQNDLRAIPIHPSLKSVEGEKAYPSLSDLPEKVHGISVITPPAVTRKILEEAIHLGIKNIWLQPGAEPDAFPELPRDINLIFGGPCLLVELGF